MQELDFLFRNDVDWVMAFFLAVFSVFIAIFHTVLIRAFFEIKLKPKWLFFVLNPSLVLLTKALFSKGVFFVFICLFISVFLLFIGGAIYKGISGFILKIKKRSKKEKTSAIFTSVLKNIIIIIVSLLGMLFLGAYVFVFIFIFVGIQSFVKYNSKDSFLNIQANLPTSKIASMAMGIVEVVGRVIMQEPLLTRIGKKECIGYRYKIERKTRSKDGKDSYSTISDEVTCHSFLIEDNTGKVQVDPENIQFKWLPEDSSYTSSGKRYTQYVLYDNNKMLLLGSASSNRKGVFIGKDSLKPFFTITPFEKVTSWNRFKPLLNTFLTFIGFLIVCIGFVLFANIELINNTLVFNFNIALDTSILTSFFNLE